MCTVVAKTAWWKLYRSINRFTILSITNKKKRIRIYAYLETRSNVFIGTEEKNSKEIMRQLL